MNETIVFRKMTHADIAAVAEIERESFATPWTEEIFEHELSGNAYSHYIVGERDGYIIGHCGMWIVLDECHITNVAVRTSLRGKGYGEDLMRQAMELCRLNEVKTMTLEVRVSNVAARTLYQKLGFQEGGIRKNYYTDDQEDGLVMWVEF